MKITCGSLNVNLHEKIEICEMKENIAFFRIKREAPVRENFQGLIFVTWCDLTKGTKSQLVLECSPEEST